MNPQDRPKKAGKSLTDMLRDGELRNGMEFVDFGFPRPRKITVYNTTLGWYYEEENPKALIALTAIRHRDFRLKTSSDPIIPTKKLLSRVTPKVGMKIITNGIPYVFEIFFIHEFGVSYVSERKFCGFISPENFKYWEVVS